MVPLLVATLRDNRFYLSAPEFCPQSPAAIGLICGKMSWSSAITA